MNPQTSQARQGTSQLSARARRGRLGRTRVAISLYVLRLVYARFRFPARTEVLRIRGFTESWFFQFVVFQFMVFQFMVFQFMVFQFMVFQFMVFQFMVLRMSNRLCRFDQDSGIAGISFAKSWFNKTKTSHRHLSTPGGAESARFPPCRQNREFSRLWCRAAYWKWPRQVADGFRRRSGRLRALSAARQARSRIPRLGFNSRRQSPFQVFSRRSFSSPSAPPPPVFHATAQDAPSCRRLSQADRCHGSRRQVC